MKVPVKFSGHAVEKMLVRKVRASDIYATLKSPDYIYKDVERETLIAVKNLHGKFIIVAYKIENDGAKVITIFYTTKFGKLLKTKMARGAWKKIK